MELVNNEIDGGFTPVPNATARDANLDLPALGLLVALSSHKSGFQINLERIGRHYLHGKDALSTMMGQLQVAGYVAKFRVQSAQTGQWSTVLVVSLRPMSTEEIMRHQEALEDRRSISEVQGLEPSEAAWSRAEQRAEKQRSRKK